MTRKVLGYVVATALLLGGCGDSADAPSGLGGTAKSCADGFDPARLAAGEDCRPRAGTYCPLGSGIGVLSGEVIACDGVFVSTHQAATPQLSTDYLAIGADRGRYDAILVALHYLQARTGTFANVVRLTELAKARRVLIVVPQAPSVFTQVLGDPVGDLLGTPTGIGSNLVSRWPSGTLEPVDDFVALLRAVVADARGQFNLPGVPVYAAGLSNGAVMAYHLACRAPGEFKAILATAGDQASELFDACQPTQPVGSVIVHGTGDLLTPYSGVPLLSAAIPDIHARFSEINGCDGADAVATMPTRSNDPLRVSIRWTAPCLNGRRNFLVTVEYGGHNWPGGPANDSLLAIVGLLGPHTLNFDTTVQGYDLLRLAAGD